MVGFLMSFDFNKSTVDSTYFITLLVTYYGSLIVGCKHALASDFEIKDLGMIHYFLGLGVWQRNDEIFLSQGKYTVEIFSMTECKSMPTLMVMDLKKINNFDSSEIDPQLIGSLMYLVNTILDICYAVNVLSQFMSQPRQTNWITTKHVLRYLRGTVGYGLRYASSVNLSSQGYAVADWAGIVVERKSTSGCCFTLGSAMVS
jgi:hypothetical protein